MLQRGKYKSFLGAHGRVPLEQAETTQERAEEPSGTKWHWRNKSRRKVPRIVPACAQLCAGLSVCLWAVLAARSLRLLLLNSCHGQGMKQDILGWAEAVTADYRGHGESREVPRFSPQKMTAKLFRF